MEPLHIDLPAVDEKVTKARTLTVAEVTGTRGVVFTLRDEAGHLLTDFVLDIRARIALAIWGALAAAEEVVREAGRCTCPPNTGAYPAMHERACPLWPADAMGNTLRPVVKPAYGSAWPPCKCVRFADTGDLIHERDCTLGLS